MISRVSGVRYLTQELLFERVKSNTLRRATVEFRRYSRASVSRAGACVLVLTLDVAGECARSVCQSFVLTHARRRVALILIVGGYRDAR